jgi:hypothetical protein
MKVVHLEASGVVVDGVADRDSVLALLLRVGVDEDPVGGVFDIVDDLGRFWPDRLLAVQTAGSRLRREFAAARALDRGNRLLVVLGLDVQAVGGGDLPVTGVSEDGNVPSGDIRPTRPAVVFFEDRLTDALTGEVRRTGLSEVGDRRWLLHVGPVRALVDDIAEALVGDLRLAVGEQTPQRRGAIVTGRVGIEPCREMSAGDEQRDRPLALLTVDVELQPVVVIGDVADREVVEFAATEACIPRDRQQGLVARVVRVLDHRDDVAVPVEHVRRVRRRVVRPAGRRRDPREFAGDLVAVSDELAEHPQGDAHVAIRLLVVVLGVDPVNDLLGSVAVLEGVSQRRLWCLIGADAGFDVTSEDATVPDELQMASVRVLPEGELTVEFLEEILITFVELVGVLDLLAIVLDPALRAFGHTQDNSKRDGTLNQRYNSRARTFLDPNEREEPKIRLRESNPGSRSPRSVWDR